MLSPTDTTRALFQSLVRSAWNGFARHAHTSATNGAMTLDEQTRAAAAFVDRMQTLYCARNAQYGQIVHRIEQANMINRRCRLPSDDARAQQFYSAGATRKQQFSVPNDHMAIRTIANDTIGLDAIERLLSSIGFVPKDYYAFPDKHLRARWFAPPETRSMPRLFVSELLLSEMSSPVQRLLSRYIDKKAFRPSAEGSGNVSPPALRSPLLSGIELADWFDAPISATLPTLPEYQTLLDESEYAAWTLMNGNRVNHCTIAVSFLNQPYNSLEKFMQIASDEWRLPLHNDGAIQCSDDGRIKQSSTAAITSPLMLRRSSTPIKVPGSFVEFIERDREGFEAQNANAIFESTNVKK